MKWFRREADLGSWRPRLRTAALVAGLAATSAGALGAMACLQSPGLLLGAGNGIGRWLENAESGSGVESALYRLMKLPAGEILYRRSPRETRPELTGLLNASQQSAALYSLRAMEDEQALDFEAAERDWRAWAEKSSDKAGADFDLADFYDRRLRPQEELAALEAAGQTAETPRERFVAPASQQAWKAWERSLEVVGKFALPAASAQRIYAGWERRYPQESSVYARELDFDLTSKDFNGAAALIERYQKTFPADPEFPVAAEARLAAARGSAKDGLAVYDRSFDPLWPASLVKSYCDLLTGGHQLKKVSDALKARLAAHPEGGAEALKDAARLFYIDQQQGQMETAKMVLGDYRARKEVHGAVWSADELYTLGRLLEAVQDFPEAGRYYYALAAQHATPDAEEKGLAGLARILLTAPEQPLRLGEGNLALYKSIATMDRGPGYLNGILSLWMNSQSPSSEYATEDQLATPYFHRAKAAELVAEIDKRFPQAPERPELHARLMDAFGAYGENDAIVREGTAFLAQFPNDARRVEVALAVADVYSRTSQSEKEFALYRTLLKELATKADGVPLGAAVAGYNNSAGVDIRVETNGAATGGARSGAYAQVLDRYLSRLVSMQRLPDALELLRGELDRNPEDPGLYQKLAQFLEQNRLNGHEEEVYQRAIQRFQQSGFVDGWYGKLARLYLREKRREDYSALSKKVTNIFSGTELEAFLREAPAPDSSLALEVELYAHQRFPHDLTFVRSLLAHYRRYGPQAEEEKLLWQHWWESANLRDELFEMLSREGRLDAQLETLRHESPEIDKRDWSALAKSNPAAERFWLESCLWQSQFEEGVGAAEALSGEYPADETLGGEASSLDRSLAYFHPEDTDKAVAIEQRLLNAKPGDLETLARIGDMYADRGRMSEAAPYWARMAEAHPGDADGYLQSATVFWDYFDFPSALTQLHKGRERLAQPALFGYQAGAIEESRGNAASAVKEYVVSSLADSPSAESRERLMTLARRAPMHEAIEAETAGLLKAASPTSAAISLRVDVLDAERRKQDMAAELKQAVAQTESFDTLDALSQAARTHELPEVDELALGRQIALTEDPVHRIELRYQLVELLGQRNAAAAAAEVDAIYREHPKVLGVVRSTVDYNWNHQRKQQAVTVLLDSAQAAYPELKGQFQLEAARKLTELSEYARAKTLLEPLLSQKPLDASVEAALADNYAHSGDQAGLEAFYKAQLAVVKGSALERGEKTTRLAQLRRGMIGAASLLGNWGEAADQYIELINAYPGDAGLIQEAALASGAHGQREKLLGFYRKTVEASPRDARWSMVLAQLETALEDYPAAIEAYGKAIRIRPEQKDLYQSKADLEERLYKLDDAVADYEKLYTLSYHDPQWMVKEAEARARQGRNADAVKALESAWIAGRPQATGNSFKVAAQLEQWGLLDEARSYAERGVELAGADLLVDGGNQQGAETYARIMARLRQSDAAFTKLAVARQQAEKLPLAAVAQQVTNEGIAAVTDDEWRRQRVTERTAQAKQGFANALRALAGVVGEYGTPEEKAQFGSWLQAKMATASGGGELRDVYLPAIRAAGLVDMEADLLWRFAEKSGNPFAGELNEWVHLQRRRVQMEGAGAKIEALAASVSPETRPQVWSTAAEVYRTLGDNAGELRMWDKLMASRSMDDDDHARYFSLLLAERPRDLIAGAHGDKAAQFLVANGSVDQAFAGIAARATRQNTVWKNAYTGLTGLYLRAHRPEVKKGFEAALGGDPTIGERIAHPADRDQQLAGDVWFYYGSRYGEYLDEEKDSLAEGYLESELEHTPGRAGAYKELAEYSAEAGRAESTLADYRRSLELNEDQPAVWDSIAVLEQKRGQQADAIAAWEQAVKLLAAEMDARHGPETFWGDFSLVLGDAAANGQYAAIDKAVDSMLRVYIARNGDYRTESLLRAGYQAHGNSLDWLIGISSATKDQAYLLSTFERSNWIAKDQESRLLGKIVELRRGEAQAKPGENDYQLDQAMLDWIDALLAEKKFTEARAEFARIPAEKRRDAQWLGAELRLAEADSALPQLVAQWKKDPATAPESRNLTGAALKLGEPTKRIVMRFVYERALEARELTAPNFLGLAAIDLDEGNLAGAIDLLKRLTLVSSNTFADTDSAAGLLETHGHPSEAIQFLQPLVGAFPWNPSYKTRLAVAQLAKNKQSQTALGVLKAVASDPKARYEERLAAAKALKGFNPPNLASGSAELDMLALSGCPSAEEAGKPYFIETRKAAAACATDPKVREQLLRSALAAAPNDTGLRTRYAFAAFETGLDARGLLTAEPLLQGGQFYSQRYMQRDDSGYGEPDGDSSDSSYESADQRPYLSAQLKPEDAARLTWFAIHAREKRHENDDAKTLAERALNAETDPARRKAFEEENKRLEIEAAREQENESRAPKIHNELDQDRVVRPRLLPGMTFVPKKAASREEDAE